MKNGFDDREFINYFVYEKFNKYEHGRELLEDVIEKILIYAHKNKNISKDQFIYFLFDILPAMDFGEIAQFASDEILTENGKFYKRDYLTKEDAPRC